MEEECAECEAGWEEWVAKAEKEAKKAKRSDIMECDT